MQNKFWDFEGDLYSEKTGYKVPFRTNYKRHHKEIQTVADCKATIRAGEYAWPGGYPLFLLTSDGCPLCFDCAREEFSQIAYAIKYKLNDGWRIVGCDINYEEKDMLCGHCGERIESAYGDDE